MQLLFISNEKVARFTGHAAYIGSRSNLKFVSHLYRESLALSAIHSEMYWDEGHIKSAYW